MILNLFLGLPILLGLVTYLLNDRLARGFGMLVTLIQIMLATVLVGTAHPESPHVFIPWIEMLGIHWSLALDGANFLLVFLTPVISLLAIAAVGQHVEKKASFVASLLLLNGCLSGLFLAQNLGLFYLFYEAMLIPTLILVAGWARKDGPETAMRFLLFTLVGSLPMLLAVLGLGFSDIGGVSLEFSELGNVPADIQRYLFIPFLLAFLIKMPMVPFHGWLPSLYRNSPAAVTVIIAGLMGKAGTYGLFKVGLTVFPDALRELSALLTLLAVITIIYGAMAAMGADSVREVLGYSSLAHMGMIMVGLSSVSLTGLAGANLEMGGHAVATGGLFLIVALMENRQLSDDLQRFGGLSKLAPRLAATTLFLALASMGQPGLSSFPGELLILTGAWELQPVLTVLATLGIILAAAYLLRWYQLIFNGPVGSCKSLDDLTTAEMVIVSIPICLTVAIGIAPHLFIHQAQIWLEKVY